MEDHVRRAIQSEIDRLGRIISRYESRAEDRAAAERRVDQLRLMLGGVASAVKREAHGRDEIAARNKSIIERCQKNEQAFGKPSFSAVAGEFGISATRVAQIVAKHKAGQWRATCAPMTRAEAAILLSDPRLLGMLCDLAVGEFRHE